MKGLFLVVVGIAWATRAVIGLTDADFWNASTLLDYASVWTYSLALLLIAPALLILVRQAESGRVATLVAWVVAAGAILAAVANGIEDGLGHKEWGAQYVLGAGIVGLGLIALAVGMASGRRKIFALVPMLTLAGLLAFSVGGGFVIAATWAALGFLVVTGRTKAPISNTSDWASGPQTA
ncbi:MAG: hypothetical protein ACAH65_00565 [Chloroflexota bacterium]